MPSSFSGPSPGFGCVARGGSAVPAIVHVLALPVEHLLAVERHGEVVDLVEELVDLALLEIEAVQRRAFRSAAVARRATTGGRLGEEERRPLLPAAALT